MTQTTKTPDAEQTHIRKTQRTRAASARSEPSDAERLHEVLSAFRNVVLMTPSAGEGHALNGRPMHVASLESDNDLWFFTRVDAAQTREAMESDDAYVVAQDSTRQVVMRGRVFVSKDRDKLDQLWSPAAQVFFPDGKDDPDLCLLAFVPCEAEYWDLSGTKSLRYALDLAYAYVKGETPPTRDEQHAKVVLDPQ